MCVPYFVNGVEIPGPPVSVGEGINGPISTPGCWCPLGTDSEEYFTAFGKAIYEALVKAQMVAMEPENASVSEDGRIAEVVVRGRSRREVVNGSRNRSG